MCPGEPEPIEGDQARRALPRGCNS